MFLIMCLHPAKNILKFLSFPLHLLCLTSWLCRELMLPWRPFQKCLLFESSSGGVVVSGVGVSVPKSDRSQ